MVQTDQVSNNNTPPPVDYSSTPKQDVPASDTGEASQPRFPSRVRIRPGSQSSVTPAGQNPSALLGRQAPKGQASTTPRETSKEEMKDNAAQVRIIVEEEIQRIRETADKSKKDLIEQQEKSQREMEASALGIQENLANGLREINEASAQHSEEQQKRLNEQKAAANEIAGHVEAAQGIVKDKIETISRITSNIEQHFSEQLEKSKAEIEASASIAQCELAAKGKELQDNLMALKEEKRVEKEQEQSRVGQLESAVADIKNNVSAQVEGLEGRIKKIEETVASLSVASVEKEKEKVEREEGLEKEIQVLNGLIKELAAENASMKEQIEGLQGRLPPRVVEDITASNPPAPRTQPPLSANQRLSRAVGNSNWFCKGLFWGLSIFTAGIFYLGSLGFFWLFSIGKED